MSENASTTNSLRLLAMDPALPAEMCEDAVAGKARPIDKRAAAPTKGHGDSGASSAEGWLTERREASQTVAELHRLAERKATPCLFLLEFPENSLTSLLPGKPMHELGTADEAFALPDKLSLLQELAERDKAAHSLILCEKPPVSLARLLEKGIPSQQALQLWCARTAQLLAFVRRFRRRMSLLDRTAFWEDPQAALLHLGILARVESPPAEEGEEVMASPSPLARLVAIELLRRDLRAGELADELEASTSPLTVGLEDSLDLDGLFHSYLVAQEASGRLAEVEQQAQLVQEKATTAASEAAKAREMERRTARHLSELQEEHEATLEQLLKAQEITETDRLRLSQAEERLGDLEQRSKKQAQELEEAERKAAQQTQKLQVVTQEAKEEARRAREAEHWLAKRDAKLAWIYGTRTYRWTLWLRWLGRKLGGTTPAHWNAQ